jgi:AcrR family transcriptional regulator
MGRPQRVDDRELLAAARRVFLERGPAATTREIARAANVSQAVLFQRFRTRDDLLLAAMMPAPPDMAALLGPEDDARRLGPRAWLVEVGVRALGFFIDSAPAFFHLVVHPSFRAEVFARVHEHVPIVALIVGLAGRLDALQRQRRLGEFDPRIAAEALMGFVHNLGMFGAMAHPGFTAEAGRERVQAFVDVLWHGLAPAPG